MFDLVVLGDGPEGVSVASAAARIGAKVALIQGKNPAAACSHAARIARIALLEAAHQFQRLKESNTFGIRVGPAEVDFPAVMARVRAVVADVAGSDSRESLRALGIELHEGSPSFEAYDTILVDGKTRIPAQRFVIATGSRRTTPNIPGLVDAGHLDDASVLDFNQLPASLVILGEGPEAIELAQAFARFGSKVTLLADSDRILPREDSEVSGCVAAVLASEGVTIRSGVEATRISVRDGQKVCAYRLKSGGAPGEASGAQILVAAGRLANIEGLNLESVGIKGDREHGIEVDEYLQTRSTRVFAIGEVLQRPASDHAAEREASVVFHNAVLRLPRKIDYSGMASAIFVEPEVASVGLSEAVARERRPDCRVVRADFAKLDRARIDGRTTGFAKVVATPAGKILGATVVGEQADLILQVFVVAMECGVNLADLATALPLYPSYGGLARQLAEQFAATRVEGGLIQSAMKWFLGYKPRIEPDAEAKQPEHETQTPVGNHGGSHGH